MKKSKGLSAFIGLSLAALIITVPLLGFPLYRVWQQEMSGKAKLREAQWSRQIIEQEATAQANAEILLATSQAEANRIIAEGLGGPEGYLRWKWIQAIQTTDNQIIYIPTEAGLPVLEAGQR